jgi:dolichol kinase
MRLLITNFKQRYHSNIKVFHYCIGLVCVSKLFYYSIWITMIITVWVYIYTVYIVILWYIVTQVQCYICNKYGCTINEMKWNYQDCAHFLFLRNTWRSRTHQSTELIRISFPVLISLLFTTILFFDDTLIELLTESLNKTENK